MYLASEFIQFLKDMKVHELNAEEYIFSKKHTLAPGSTPILRNRVSEKWKEIIKDGYSIHKDMYAAKHTSAKLFIMNGGSKESLQMQMGHSTISTTEIYLRKTLPEESLTRYAKEFKSGPLSPKNPTALRTDS